MEKQEILIVGIAIAIFLACVAIFMAASVQQAPAGITYDPTRQPMLLPMRELTSSTDPVSGIILDYQKINTSGSAPAASAYIGQVATLDGSTWIAAQASSSSNMNGKLGIVVKVPSTNVSADGQILMQGVVRNSSWALTKGTTYYVNATTPGTFNSVKSADTAEIQPIGWGYNTTVLYFNPVINASANTM
jgi:hypothetical protein